MWKEFRVAVSFLTTLPLKYKGEWDEKTFSRASIFYPLVGVIIGLITVAVMYLISLTDYVHIAAFTEMCIRDSHNDISRKPPAALKCQTNSFCGPG